MGDKSRRARIVFIRTPFWCPAAHILSPKCVPQDRSLEGLRKFVGLVRAWLTSKKSPLQTRSASLRAGSGPTTSRTTRGYPIVGKILSVNFRKGLHVALDLSRNFVLGDFQIITGLEVHPESRAVSEITRKAQGRIRSDATPLVDDIGDSRNRYAQGHGHLVHAQSERCHEFFAENLSRMHRF